MQPSHLHDHDSASTPDYGSEQLILPQGTQRRFLASAFGLIQHVNHIATLPPTLTPSPGMAYEDPVELLVAKPIH
jgi:hypothetical protein